MATWRLQMMRTHNDRQMLGLDLKVVDEAVPDDTGKCSGALPVVYANCGPFLSAQTQARPPLGPRRRPPCLHNLSGTLRKVYVLRSTTARMQSALRVCTLAAHFRSRHTHFVVPLELGDPSLALHDGAWSTHCHGTLPVQLFLMYFEGL